VTKKSQVCTFLLNKVAWIVGNVFLNPRKKILPREFSIFYSRSYKSAREKNLEMPREEKIVPEKIREKSNQKKKNYSPVKIINFHLKIKKIP